MDYVIDGNNLAGSLDILKEKDFDKKLIKILKDHFKKKKCFVFLVFDGIDRWGDKEQSGNLFIIYSPRDNYTKDADGKILQILPTLLDVYLVTNDRNLIKRSYELKPSIKVLSSTNLAAKIDHKKSRAVNDEEWSEKEIQKLNQELLDKFSI